ncbi:helix-turn-helix transcriptional regulator [Kitasatospora sp. NPDC002227]|uniref:helix-turn-helix domain-containing protein n=1 Tax=Kitasatospora sp. NPDC002227 TaxID=3154773 RepID=UPI00331AE05C
MARYPDPNAVISASSLIRRARTGTPDLSQNDLATAAGIGQTALSRYELGKREPTFADLQNIVGNSDYRLEVYLRREPRHQSPVATLLSYNAERFAVADRDLVRLLPPHLAPEKLQDQPSEQDGPRLSDALLHYYEIRDLLRDTRRVEERLQQTFEQFGNARDIELIHQMLQVGIGAGQAATTLARAIDTGATTGPAGRRKTDPQDEPRLTRTEWAHVACCLRAEEAILRDRVERLHQALTAADHRDQAAARLREAEALARTDNRTGDDPHVERARAELDAATRRCAALSRNGGTADVGRAGERYLAVELAELADRASALFSALAADPAFARWRSEYAALDPLYDQWLDGPLSAALTPPQLYADTNAFYEANPALAAPWKTELEGGAAAHPFGSDERRAVDHLDREWQITVVGPTSNDPREWPKPEAAVVATYCPDLSANDGKAAVYVLAENLHGAQAANLVQTAPNPASLTGITARLTARSSARG